MEDNKFDKLGSIPIKAAALEQHPNFAQFNQDDLKALSDYCTEKHLGKDELLFSEGEAGNSMFIVKKGSVKITKTGFLGENIIAQVNPGEFVGELAVIDGSPRSAAAKAAVESDLLVLTSENLDKLKKENPVMAIKFMGILLRILSLRLRNTTQRMLKK